MAVMQTLFADSPMKTQVYYTQWCRRKGAKEWIHMGTPDSHQAESKFEKWATNPDYEYRLDKKTSTKTSIVISPDQGHDETSS